MARMEGGDTPLAACAMREVDSRGRRRAEPAHPYRGIYARDRDRIIHSRAFRRLEAKTQVFTTRYSDHFRNRLTHTLEVAQIARTVAGALGLNSDLAEALALAHDIGHPPFGHAGEHCLDALMREHGEAAGFDHNLHALRIVEQFEQRYISFTGLNLTFEVREGIIKHSRDYAPGEFSALAEYALDLRPPLEAQLIDQVDEIAYNTADLDDGLEAGLLTLAQIRDAVPLFDEIYAAVEREHPAAREKLRFNEANRRALDRLVTDLIATTRDNVRAAGAHSVEEIRRRPRLAGLGDEAARRSAEWKKFLTANLYDHPNISQERQRSVRALAELFRHYVSQPHAMPRYYAELALREGRARVACDYIAGMTDHFLLRQHAEITRI
jgi:dGTPase